jgi:type I restriction enzyme S subunit
LWFPVPPLEEQRAVAAYLDSETAKIDALTKRVRDGIVHLKELRTALISAAVTGKIDVRNVGAHCNVPLQNDGASLPTGGAVE